MNQITPPFDFKKKSIIFLLISMMLVFLMFIQGCGLNTIGNKSQNQNVLHGYSGMTQFSADKYLVVHDTKGHEEGQRVGILTIKQDLPLQYESIQIDNWHDPDGRPRDLESACSLPGTDHEFLVAESGYRKGKYGRIFHLKITDTTTVVKHVFKQPQFKKADNKPVKNNHEAMLCVSMDNGRTLIVLGERGGSSEYPSGVLRWAFLDKNRDTMSWNEKSTKGIPINAPGVWFRPEHKRDIAAMYVDNDKKIWAAASEDSADNGPFRSIIYHAATLSNNSDDPINRVISPKAAWTIDGFKVEALSGPPSSIPNSVLSIATEDENYGGIFRPLFPTSSPLFP